MIRGLFLLAMVPAVFAQPRPVAPAPMPLSEVALNVGALTNSSTANFRWNAISGDGANRKSKRYGTIHLSTEVEQGKIRFHDVFLITMHPEELMTFDRRMTYPITNLFAPETIAIDLTMAGQTIRQLTYTNGAITEVGFSGGTNTYRPKFADGILTFNALLRLAPLLPQEAGKSYTFTAFAEPLLFHPHESKERGAAYTLRFLTNESIKIESKTYECARLRMILPDDFTADLWLSGGRVVKFSMLMDKSDAAQRLEATVEE